MSRKEPARPTHEDAKAIRRAVAYLEKLGRLDELQRAVMADVADILDEALTSGAVIRIRILNQGTPPSERKRQAARATLVKARARKFVYAAPEWTSEENVLFRHLWAETDTPTGVIADRFGRTPTAVQNHATELGVRRSPGYLARTTPLGRARLVIARRRAQEQLAQRNLESPLHESVECASSFSACREPSLCGLVQAEKDRQRAFQQELVEVI
jgi:23S rRNA G2069 N7-methylase RlmK/C1962 C5-methylase RlmI